MTDKELLELAARAAGVSPVLCYEAKRNCLRIGDRKSYSLWRPLTDDGDALRLAVKLGLQIFPDDMRDKSVALVQTNDDGIYCAECYEDDGCEAVRLAIVRAAAEIGKAMP